jgi:predicted TIM-barrel fold metal-dependent hydrolase
MTNLEGGIVDCELHPLIGSLEQLLEHVEDPSWAERLRTSEFALPQASPHPGVEVEGHRVDAAASDPAAVSAGLEPEVEAALLVPAQAMASSGWLSHTMAEVFCSAVNDALIAEWLPADERFRLALAVSPHDGELAAEEIRRLGEHPAVAAVCLPLIAVNMGQRHYHPIYEAAERLELPVMVHPGGFEGSVIGPASLGGVGPRTPEETFSLLPQVAMANLASLIYDGVFERFGGLQVLFAGFGFSWAPPVLWRADSEWRGLRVEVPWLTKAPSEYVADHVRFLVDAACELSDQAWKVAAMLPPSSLLYGSDRPFASQSAAEALAGAPPGLRAGIAAENARQTIGRSVKDEHAQSR